MLIALSQDSNEINVDPLLFYLRFLQMLFAFSIITLLLFDQFNLHIEGRTMNVNLSRVLIFMSAINVCFSLICSSSVTVN